MNDIFFDGTDKDRAQFFGQMSKEQAEAFFNNYLDSKESRLRFLNRSYWSTGGGNESDLDFSPESLLPLWAWARRRLTLQGYSRTEFEGLKTQQGHIRDGELISELSKDTLILVDDLGYYLGDSVVHCIDGVEWGIFETRIKGHVSKNQPILTGLRIPCNPRESVRLIATRDLRRDGSDRALFELFETMMSLASTG